MSGATSTMSSPDFFKIVYFRPSGVPVVGAGAVTMDALITMGLSGWLAGREGCEGVV
ncbi:MAG: hypothetical protein WDO73_30000 [Ignavibacteriota bacterium]